MKNGNGKEIEFYDNGKIKFEGEYLNGKRIGYNESGKLSFEGEYLEGKRKGNGKEYKIWGWIFRWRKKQKRKRI